MRKFLLFSAFVLTAILSAAFLLWISAGEAKADNTINYSSLTTAQKTAMKNAILSEPNGGSGGWSDPQTYGMYIAAAGAGVELTATSTAIADPLLAIPLAFSGYADSVFGYKIANPVGGYIYRRITGESYTGSTTSPSGTVTLTGFKWVYNLSSDFPANTWAMDIKFASPTCGGTFCGSFTDFICSPGASNCDSSHTGNNGEAIPYASILQNGVASLAPLTTSYGLSGSSVCPWSVKPSSCTTVFRTNAQMDATAQVRPDTPTGFASLPAADQRVINPSTVQWPNKSSLSDADLQAALNAIAAATAAAQNAAQAAAVAILRAAAGIPDFNMPDCRGLSTSACTAAVVAAGGASVSYSSTTLSFSGADVTKPAGSIVTQSPAPGSGMTNGAVVTITVNPANVDMPFNVPKPYTYETYGDYITRLQAGGWVGTATEIDLSDPQTDASVGPNGVPRLVLQLNGTGSPQILQTGNWPTTTPKAKRGVSINVYKNPSSAPYVPPDPTDPPNPDPGQIPGTNPTPEECSTCAIDWTPIESINYGGKFPFGFVTWIGNFFSSIPTGSCPNLSIGKPSALGGGTLSISFCSSSWESTWRSPIFLVLEALMTLAGVIFLAQRILGFGSDDE